jgi:hypothetical protein
VYYDVIPSALKTFSQTQTWTFLISLHTSASKAKSDYSLGRFNFFDQSIIIYWYRTSTHTTGLQLIREGQLLKKHCSAWADVWAAGHVALEGDLDQMRTSNAAFFYLMSSLPMVDDPTWPYIGISPTGLPGGETDVRNF